MSVRFGKTAIGGQQRRIQRLGQRDVERVVRANAVGAIPRPVPEATGDRADG